MNDPTIVEERGSECNLADEGYNRLLDRDWFFVEHRLKVRSNNLQYQHIMLSVCAPHLEMIQESEDMIGSRRCACSGGEMMINLDLVVLAGKLSHGELEGNILAT